MNTPIKKSPPSGYRSVTPYLIVKGAAEALTYYKEAFGASERMRMPMPDGRVAHAEMEFGDSVIMCADEFPEMNAKSPKTLGGTPVNVMLYVDDVDEVFARAVKLGGTVQRDVADQFYGDRNGTFVDPFGHVWTLATRVEEVSPEEMQRRMTKA